MSKEDIKILEEYIRQEAVCNSRETCKDCEYNTECIDRSLLSNRYFEKIEKINKATENVLKELKKLKKGQYSLMRNRKKWKDRYYKLRAKMKNKAQEENERYLEDEET